MISMETVFRAVQSDMTVGEVTDYLRGASADCFQPYDHDVFRQMGLTHQNQIVRSCLESLRKQKRLEVRSSTRQRKDGAFRKCLVYRQIPV